MTLRSLFDKTSFVFKPFARISDTALYAVGHRETAEETEQPIPMKLAVSSALLLVPVYILASCFLGIIWEGIQIQYEVRSSPLSIVLPIILCLVGFLLAPLQVRRVLRLNRRARRHRLSNLERMVIRETATQENAPSLSRYEVEDSSPQFVSQGN